MKKNLFLSAIFATMFACQPASAAPSKLQTTLEGNYAVLRQAIDNRDGDTVTSLLSEDFVSSSIDGQTQSGKQMVKDLVRTPKAPANKSRTTILSLKQAKNKVLVTQRYEMNMVSPDAKKLPLELVTEASDVWKKEDGIWLLQKSSVTKTDFYTNGKNTFHKVRSVK